MFRGDRQSMLTREESMVQTPTSFVLFLTCGSQENSLYLRISPFLVSQQHPFLTERGEEMPPLFTKGRRELIALKLRKHKIMENSDRPIKGNSENDHFYVFSAYSVTWTSILSSAIFVTTSYGFQSSSSQVRK